MIAVRLCHADLSTTKQRAMWHLGFSKAQKKPSYDGQKCTGYALAKAATSAAVDFDEKVRFYSEAIRLKPDYAIAFKKRGDARHGKGDLDGATADHKEAE